jgi:nucleoside triphosphate diphosphatase
MKQLERLLLNMKSLRDPEKGCPWDREQTIDSIKGYTIEETYELIDAIDRNDIEGIKDELGDLLFHIIFYSEMADEKDYFDFESLVKQLNDKLERRHPHVFSDTEIKNSEQVKALWEQIKQQERNDVENEKDIVSKKLLDDVAKHMPAIQTAARLQKRAASVGFDWSDSEDIFKKLEEELAELREAVRDKDNIEHITEELGDLIFCCVNLARHCQVDSELALRSTNNKFIERFNYIENTLRKNNKTLEEASLEEMDALWDEAKIKLT